MHIALACNVSGLVSRLYFPLISCMINAWSRNGLLRSSKDYSAHKEINCRQFQKMTIITLKSSLMFFPLWLNNSRFQ